MKIARSTKNFGKLGFVIDFRTAQLAVSHFYIFLQKSFVLEKKPARFGKPGRFWHETFLGNYMLESTNLPKF